MFTLGKESGHTAATEGLYSAPERHDSTGTARLADKNPRKIT